MTQIQFSDKKKEIVIKTEVEPYFVENGKEHIDIKFLEKNKEIFQIFDNMWLSKEDNTNKGLMKREFEFYEYLIENFIPEKTRAEYKLKVIYEDGMVKIPIKLYLIIMINGCLTANLDTLGYAVNLDNKNMKSSFMKNQYRLIEISRLIFAQIICRGSYIKEYFFDKKTYGKLKELLKEFMKIEKKDADVLLLKNILSCVDYEEIERISPLKLSKEDIKEIKSGLKTKNYYMEEKSPNMLDYILFKLLFLNENPIIVITKGVGNIEVDVGYNILITDEDGVKDLLKKGESLLVINPFYGMKEKINGGINGPIGEYIKHLREKIKMKLGDGNGSIENIAEDLEKFRTIAKNGTLVLNVHNEEYITMVGDFTSSDLERYDELDRYVGDYGFITPKRNGARPKTIVGQKQHKYK